MAKHAKCPNCRSDLSLTVEVAVELRALKGTGGGIVRGPMVSQRGEIASRVAHDWGSVIYDEAEEILLCRSCDWAGTVEEYLVT